MLRRIARTAECLPFSAQNWRIATKNDVPSAAMAKPRMATFTQIPGSR